MDLVKESVKMNRYPILFGAVRCAMLMPCSFFLSLFSLILIFTNKVLSLIIISKRVDDFMWPVVVITASAAAVANVAA